MIYVRGILDRIKVMGLDVGSKTIGVAISDDMGWTAQGVTTVKRENLKEDLKKIFLLIEEYQVENWW